MGREGGEAGRRRGGERKGGRESGRREGGEAGIRVNHQSNTTCLTQAFFKSDEEYSTLWCLLTLYTMHSTNEAAVDK